MSKGSPLRKSSCLPLLFSCSIVIVFVTLQVFSWMPAGQLFSSKTRGSLAIVSEFTIQGWAFFTKSPRGESIMPYQYDESGSEWKEAVRGPNTQLKYAFGLNRDSRLTEFDIQLLLSNLDDDLWSSCEDVSEIESCIADTQVIEKTIFADNFELYGDIVLVKSVPVPWAYRNIRSGMPGEVVRINVECG